MNHAMNALFIYIATRLAADDEHQWTENAVITYIWMMTTPRQTDPVIPLDFEDTLDSIHQSWGKVLSPVGAHAALIVSSGFV